MAAVIYTSVQGRAIKTPRNRGTLRLRRCAVAPQNRVLGSRECYRTLILYTRGKLTHTVVRVRVGLVAKKVKNFSWP